MNTDVPPIVAGQDPHRGERFRLSLRADPREFAVVRREVRAQLRLWGRDQLTYNAAMCVTELLSNADYPADARRNREQGLVRFRIVIGTDGRVSDCTVTGSSGHATLDAATCALARERFRFVPGRDELNLPTSSLGDYVMIWRLPG